MVKSIEDGITKFGTCDHIEAPKVHRKIVAGAKSMSSFQKFL